MRHLPIARCGQDEADRSYVTRPMKNRVPRVRRMEPQARGRTDYDRQPLESGHGFRRRSVLRARSRFSVTEEYDP